MVHVIKKNNVNNIKKSNEVFDRIVKNNKFTKTENPLNAERVIKFKTNKNMQKIINDKYEIPDASDEQIKIIEYLKDNNVIVDSVVGSGKTTSVLHIAKNFINSKILLLTYNSRLKFETRKKVESLYLKNIEVHSYHSFCFKYFNQSCRTDIEIRKYMACDKIDNFNFKYDFIILDEAQDITPLYFELIHFIMKNNVCLFKICMLGDIHQSIFDFNGADERFLTYGDILFNINKYQWKKTKLSISYRLTSECSNFLNECILKDNRINAKWPSPRGFAIKNGNKIRYIICDCFGDAFDLSEKNKSNYNKLATYEEVIKYLDNYNYDDIFVLAPSVKSLSSPIRKLANALSDNNIPVYVPGSDDEKIDDDILRGKIAFCTFHQTKGLERKVVLVFNMDESYFIYFKKEANPDKCPNEIYVALTRSSEKMTLLHHNKNNFLPFINHDILIKNCDYIIKDKLKVRITKKKNKPIAVTDLIKHMRDEDIHCALKYLEVNKIMDIENKITITLKTKQKYNNTDIYENVSEINGIAIPAYFELINTNKMTIYDTLRKHIDYSQFNRLNDKNESNYSMYLFGDNENIKNNTKNMINMDNINLSNITTKELLFIANEYCSFVSGYVHKLNQINSYDWLPKAKLCECCDRLKKIISSEAVYEKKICSRNGDELQNKIIQGSIDCIDNNKLYEFKCVDGLKSEHFLQLAIYQYLNEMNIINDRDKELSNVEEIDNGTMDISLKLNEKIEFLHKNIKISGIITNITKNGWINIDINNVLINMRRNDIKIFDAHKIDTKKKEIEEKYKLLKYKYYLFNILNNEMYEIVAPIENLKKMIKYLIDVKYNNNNCTSDSVFIDKMLIILSRVWNKDI